METVNILIVEDYSLLQKSYQDAVLMVQENHSDLHLETIICGSSAEARDHIAKRRIDAAIVDLRIPVDVGDVESSAKHGSSIVCEIFSTRQFPVYIVSGFPEEADLPEGAEGNPFIKVLARDAKDYDEIIEEILMVFRTGITRILSGEGLVNKQMNLIFWQHIAHIFPTDVAGLAALTEKQILRHLSVYLLEYMQLTDDSETDNFSASECILIPPVRSKLHTGDLILQETDWYLVLTPACDFSSGKAGMVTVARVRSFSEFSGLKDKFQNMKRNREARYHFLPQRTKFPGGFVDFSCLSSAVAEIYVEPAFRRAASVSALFRKDIVSRFAAYYARQGQPNIEEA